MIRYEKESDIVIPTLASLFFLNKKSARSMHAGRVPGVNVSTKLLRRIEREWQDPREGLKLAIERTARLGVVLKGIGYKGIHIGGIHDSFDTVGKILDRMAVIEHNWSDYIGEFQEEDAKRFYLYPRTAVPEPNIPSKEKIKVSLAEDCHYKFLRATHDLFFNKQAPLSPMCRKISKSLDKSKSSWLLKMLLEDPFKKLMLSCQSCGDCGIQHVGFLCPESGCPKHTRNGACGGSKDGFCEVNTDKLCVWTRAYRRMQKHGEAEKLACEIIPPRHWDLEDTSSWINFHLDRDHQKDQKK
ncbi:MAG: methylenetetrahydrofolate reductase C-terminal domain-containing protein [Desulforhopalus sp.]